MTGAESLDGYLTRLEAEPEEGEALLRDLLIGVTRFFRDPESFRTLGDRVLAPLLTGRGDGEEVRIWVPGCATGEEAYSLAILARELAPEEGGPRVQVFATDIDPRALDTARRGWYPRGSPSRSRPCAWSASSGARRAAGR